MCGIVVEAGSRCFIEPGSAKVELMAAAITHRGPDGQGYLNVSSNEWAVNLGMRRLAILDREHGKQPMHRGGASLVFNGEIYNHRWLRHNLTLTGGPFKTQCDTEALARAWEADGPDCVTTLEGMFAFAVWDRTREALYLVRDRIGKKPLYYFWDEQRNVLLAGSEIKALLVHPLVDKQINPVGLCDYLSLQYVPEPATAYKGIMCVSPGCMAIYRPTEGSFTIARWHEFDPGNYLDINPIVVRDVVDRAVAGRMESDVPLGVYLSGGIDSSIIATVANKLVPELHTFSMGFQDDRYNELPYAKRLADELGTVHHEHVCESVSLPVMADRIVAQYDQPFGDYSAIPTMLLCEASKKYITVALSGDGGDEAFGGYERYWVADRRHGVVGYTNWMMPIQMVQRNAMLAEPFKEQVKDALNTRVWLLNHAMDCPAKGVLNQWMWLDMMTYLPNDIIVKMERASMAASVEVRCPFLDHKVLELALAIPDDQKVFADTGKYILREAFQNVLPTWVLLRPKRGFSVPMNEWFREQTGVDMLLTMMTDPCWPWDVLQADRVAERVEAHLRNRTSIGHELWIILMLHLWMKKHFG